MSILQIEHVTKQFGSLLANDDISLELHQGEILALLGENGAGKTTLMNILFGHYTADAGVIKVRGKPLQAHSTDAALKSGIGMVHQHFTLADNMSVLENIVLGTESLWSAWSNRSSAREKLNGLVDRLQLAVDLDVPVSSLSIGERQRVEILKALYRDVDILILDEPTAVLTPDEVDSLFQRLRLMVENGLSIIIISHKLNEILNISDRIVVLRHGKVAGEVKTQSVDRDELATMIVGHQIDRPVVETVQHGQVVLSLNDVTVVGSNKSKAALRQINLVVREKQIVGVAGVSGNGQKELAGLLSGTLKHDAGEFSFLGSSLKSVTPRKIQKYGVARIPEDRHELGVIGEMSIAENFLLEDLGEPPCWRAGSVINSGAVRQRARDLISTFDIRCASSDIPVSLLSGGNMQKLILARNLSGKPRFVLASQPARGLDEGAIAFVHSQLLQARDNGAGVLLITEDLEELLQLSDTIVVVNDGQLSDPMDASDLTVRQLGKLMTGDESAQSPPSLASNTAPQVDNSNAI